MSISLSYSNNFDENISLVNIMIQPSDQKIKFEAILNTKFLSAIADDILMRKLKSFGRNSDGFKTFLHLLYKICFTLWGSCLEQPIIIVIKRNRETVQRSATIIVISHLCHTYRLNCLSVPLLNDFIFSCCSKKFQICEQLFWYCSESPATRQRLPSALHAHSTLSGYDSGLVFWNHFIQTYKSVMQFAASP